MTDFEGLDKGLLFVSLYNYSTIPNPYYKQSDTNFVALINLKNLLVVSLYNYSAIPKSVL